MVAIDKKPLDKITVKWIDACMRSGWMSIKEAKEIPDEVFASTRGYYIDHNKAFLTLASAVGKNKKNDVGGVWHIPLAWIQKVW